MAMTIGIPRGLMYYEYFDLWNAFFTELGCKVISSPTTDKQILEEGKKYLIDESCLPMKIYLGHIAYLNQKCDYILIPYFEKLNRKEELCTNFLVLYDLANNLFENKILSYHVNVEKNMNEEKAFIKMAKDFDFDKKQIIRAYRSAKKKAYTIKYKKIKDNLSLLKEKNKIKILLVSHSYNTYDKLIGEPIIKYLNKNNINVIHAHLNNSKKDYYKDFSKTLYWTDSKNLVNGLSIYENFVDGIIFLTAFPCGPDSLVNELCLTKVYKPTIQIILDGLDSSIGLETRLESFVDILERQKVKV